MSIVEVKEQVDTTVPLIVTMFLEGATSGQIGKYHIDGNKLVYRDLVTETMAFETSAAVYALMSAVKAGAAILMEETLDSLKARAKERGGIRTKVRAIRQDIVAARLDNGTVIGNSSVLSLIGRTNYFGRARTNRFQTEVQSLLSETVDMIPFSVFTEARLKLKTLAICDKGPAEKVTRKTPRESLKYDKKGKVLNPTETVHFTGSSLFRVDGHCFLFDIDRREIKEHIFNPFLVKLPDHVNTIEAAYDMLKPQEVKDAEARGLQVVRQGEWFFIPVESDRAQFLERMREHVKSLTLSAGPNRPNYARGLQLYKNEVVKSREEWWTDSDRVEEVQANSQYFVSGVVSHSGREHADLKLDSWYRAVPNTATQSFTITGDID
jgi:hypothetical protein